MDLQTLGKFVIVTGAAILLAGALLWLFGRLGLGSLPGDVRLGGQGWSCFLPITTSILISLLLTLLLNLLLRFFSR
jgi:hypothetical protein